ALIDINCILQYYYASSNPDAEADTPMPTLPIPRQEAFAQARAGGALLDDAYEIAGFVPGHRHASRLAKLPEVAERIGELLAARTDAKEADTRTVIGPPLR